MKLRMARGFAKAIVLETELIAQTFDGTIGDGAFRNRVATLESAINIFEKATAVNPYVLHQTDDDDLGRAQHGEDHLLNDHLLELEFDNGD